LSDVATALAAASLAAWLFLIFLRGGFWRADQRLGPDVGEPEAWPAVVAVVPARNEAPFIGHSIRALLGAGYSGTLTIVVVDDHSSDGTTEVALQAAAGDTERVMVVGALPLPAGWIGKPWALAQGVERAAQFAPKARYLWFTDADIVHDTSVLRALVAKAEADRLDLVSLMALLHCKGWWERLLMPAFVYFFQKVYPFAWVNDPKRSTAGAAGGCMLVRRRSLVAAGGLNAIRSALIDDCALAAAIKRRGPIWLGLTTATRSIRPYAGLGGVWHMVARTAFTQLRHSAILLVGTVIGMVVVYLVPPAAAIAGGLTGDWLPAGLGATGWVAMAGAYVPTLKLYRQRAWSAALLPAAAFFYTLMTVDSALRYWRGHGGHWKGRTHEGTGATGAH